MLLPHTQTLIQSKSSHSEITKSIVYILKQKLDFETKTTNEFIQTSAEWQQSAVFIPYVWGHQSLKRISSYLFNNPLIIIGF